MICPRHRHEVRRDDLAGRQPIEKPAARDQRTGRVTHDGGALHGKRASILERAHTSFHRFREVVDGNRVVKRIERCQDDSIDRGESRFQAAR